tara:strand:+ start:109 stop:651 length:543 start_codon:yes stop_codon:yes gene_type:complete
MKEKLEFTVAQIADLLGMSSRRVQQLVSEGTIRKSAHGSYDASVVTDYVRHLQQKARGATVATSTLNNERERLTAARADIAVMEMEERRGDLVLSKDVEAGWVAILALLRTRLLAIPDQLAPAVMGQKSRAAARDIIRDSLRLALEDLAEAEIGTDVEIDGRRKPRGDNAGRAGDATAAA